MNQWNDPTQASSPPAAVAAPRPAGQVYRPMLLGSSAAVLIMAGLSLLGYTLGWRLLPSTAVGLKAMSAPIALGFLALAGITGVVAYRGWTRRLEQAALVVAVGLVTAAAISSVAYFFGMDPPLMPAADLIPRTAGQASSPLAPWSVMLLAVAALALRLTVPSVTGRRVRQIGGSLALFVAISGLVLCLGYIFGEPSLYAATSPVAFASAASFVFLAASLMVSGQARILPGTAGSALRSRIARVFATMAVLMILGLTVALYQLLTTTANPLIGVIAWAILFLVISHVVVMRFARVIGDEYDAVLSERLAAEEAARSSESWFRAIFNESVDAIGIFRHGRLIFANPASLALLGYGSPDEIKGRTFPSMMAPGEARRLAEYARLRASGRPAPSTFEAHALRKDGTELEVEVHLSVYNLDGAFHSMVVVRDISDRKRAETDLRLTQLSVDRAALGVLWFRPDGAIDYANQSAADMLGYALPALKARTALDLIPGMTPAAWEAAWQTLIQEQSRTQESVLMRGDGTPLPVEITLTSASYGDRQYAFAFVRDLTERRDFQRRLRLTQASVDASSVAIFWVRADGSHYYVNDAACRLVGCSREELLSLGVSALDPGMRLSDWAAHWQKVMAAGDQTGEWTLTRPDGTTLPVESVASYVSFEGEGFLFASIQDISERLRADEALRRLNQVLEATLSSLDEAVLVLEPEGHTIASCNVAVMPVLGYSTDELVGQPAEILHVDKSAAEGFHRQVRAARIIGGTARFEYHMRRKDGAIIDTEHVVRRLPAQPGESSPVVSVIHDITARKQAEKALRDSLAEKDLLLREIHHRVKNNLQIIASLLNLQLESLTDPVAVQVIRDSQSRIRAMSLIHAKLYQSKDLAHVDFGSFVRDLASMIFHTYGASARGITCQVEATNIVLGIDTVIPCSLIVNELLSNAVRHAYPPGRRGTIRVGIAREDGRYILSVADDGVGFPATVDYRDTQSLGLRLVNMLTEQVNGELQLNRGNGAEFVVRFSGR